MGSTAERYIKEFTRHSTDMMLNLNEMRRREILTDVQLLAEGQPFRAHKAVLVACSGFFYSIFSDQSRRQVDLVSLPAGVSAGGFRLLLDFMYTSYLPLEPATVAEVLTAAGYLQMDHVVEACCSYAHFRAPLGLSAHKHQDPPPAAGPLALLTTGPVTALTWVPGGCGPRPESAFRFPAGPGSLPGGRVPWPGLRRGLELPLPPPPPPVTGGESCKPSPPLPDSPRRPGLRPSSPTESRSAGGDVTGPRLQAQAQAPGPAHQAQAPHKARNWKKYKLIVLNSLSQAVQARSPAPGALVQAEDEEVEEESSRSSTGSRGSHSYSDCSACELNYGRSSELCPHVPETPDYHSEFSDSGSGEETGVLSCRSCQVKLSDEECLQQHFLQVHRDDKPYRCSMCRAAFRYKGNLASHKTIHTGEKPYRCNVCGAQFNRPANLKTHARIHSGEKPYKCETCGARFVQVAHLRAHVLIHTGEKPYPCETCGTRFRHLQTLKSHIRIHTGEKPYHCEKCDLHFRHKSQLRLHLRQKHGAVTNTKVHYKVVLPPTCPQPC